MHMQGDVPLQQAVKMDYKSNLHGMVCLDDGPSIRGCNQVFWADNGCHSDAARAGTLR